MDEERASGIRAFFKRSKYSLLSNKHSPAQTTQRESIATYHDDHDDGEEDYLRIAGWFDDCLGVCPEYVRIYFFYINLQTNDFIREIKKYRS